MLAWALNEGFAGSSASAPASTTVYAAPFGMGLGDDLFFALSLLVWIQMVGRFL